MDVVMVPGPQSQGGPSADPGQSSLGSGEVGPLLRAPRVWDNLGKLGAKAAGQGAVGWAATLTLPNILISGIHKHTRAWSRKGNPKPQGYLTMHSDGGEEEPRGLGHSAEPPLSLSWPHIPFPDSEGVWKGSG